MLVLLCLVLPAVHATPPGDVSPDTLLSQLQRSAGNNQELFVSSLHRLERQQALLNPGQKQYLVYWMAWSFRQQRDLARSTRMYKQVVEHSDDPMLVMRAKAELVLNYMITRDYVQAFTLANELIQHLGKVTDPDVRNQILLVSNEILIWQKQYDEALKYAKQLEANAVTARDKCDAEYAVTNTLLQRGGVLTSSSPQFRHAVDTCLAADRHLTANAIRLNWASLMNDEGHPQQALEFLRRIKPDIIKTGVKAHELSLDVTRSQAYLIEKKYGLAIKWAKSTLAAFGPNDFDWKVQAAYQVLYQAQEHTGQIAEALSSYKHYITQYKRSMSHARAQALAYQIVKQEVLAKRLKLQELSKQNRILQLRQSLNRKSAETNRLYIALLLVVLASIAFWAWRIKHSQIRFRAMARHDDLTGIFNRQHFFDQAELTLHRLHKTDAHACLLILDMDHFKRINDAYGHVAGDTVLKHVVRTCREQLRDSDLFGRLGGEEFGILMPGCSIAQGTEIGERVRRSLAQSPVQVLESETVTVTSSIGLACTEEHGYALKPLLMAADHALYGAKRGGRNRLVTRTEQVAALRT